jgi:CHAT domain-containing protein/tetratricopeptide (TPR) repeat protein
VTPALRNIGLCALALVMVPVLLTSVAAQREDIRALAAETVGQYEKLQASGDYDAALIAAQKIEQLVRSRFGLNARVYATALQLLAEAKFFAKDYAAAEQHHEAAQRIIVSIDGEASAGAADNLSKLGALYLDTGRYRDAETIINKALAINKQLGVSRNSKTISLLHDLIDAYRAQNKLAETEAIYRDILATQDHPAQNTKQTVDDLKATLYSLADVLLEQNKLDEAKSYFLRAYLLHATAPKGAETAWTLKFTAFQSEQLNREAGALEAQGNTQQAEAIYKKALSLSDNYAIIGGYEGLDSILKPYEGLARLYRERGDYGHLEQVRKQIVSIKETSDADLGIRMGDVTLGHLIDRASTRFELGIAYREQGKYADAERQYKRVLATEEVLLEQNLADQSRLFIEGNVAFALNNLAVVYRAQGKYDEAEHLLERSISSLESKPSSRRVSELLSMTRANLAGIYSIKGNFSQSERLLQTQLQLDEPVFGKSSLVLYEMANLRMRQGRYAEAEALFQDGISAVEAIPRASAQLLGMLNGLANTLILHDKRNEAELVLERALPLQERTFDETAPEAAVILNKLAELYAKRGDVTQALSLSRKATTRLIAYNAVIADSGQAEESVGGVVGERANYFHTHLANLALARKTIDETLAKEEAFEIAQRASNSSTNIAIEQMAVRFASGSGSLASLIRKYQDIGAKWRDKDLSLLAEIAKPDKKPNGTVVDNLRYDIIQLQGSLETIRSQIAKQYPEYAALTSHKPLTAGAVQKLLRPDEALVYFVVSDAESHVFALTRDSVDWKVIPIGRDAVSKRVAAFRHGLDVNPLDAVGVTARESDRFDIGLANSLYVSLIEPVDSLVKDKRTLLIVPSGPLSAVPFQLLVTDKPSVGIPSNLSDYRNAAWLIKRQAMITLPSVASVNALRSVARKSSAAKPMIGFGNPIFDPQASIGATTPVGNSSTRSLATRPYAEFWQGVGLDRDKLRSLPPLPDTAVELKAVARKLGVPDSELHLGRDASVTTVKRATLERYRIVYFATHGLVAGDIKDIGEPALVLSIPAQPTELDYGLLTASEVAQLKLDADWVVLSACNTIAGDKPGADALSGLARAFFYAGARTLLVSHWAVASYAATRLATGTFDLLKNDPKLGKAEAVRRAMLNYMDDTSNPKNAYPAYWASFVLVGDGVAR